jgi:hypothetical protein
MLIFVGRAIGQHDIKVFLEAGRRTGTFPHPRTSLLQENFHNIIRAVQTERPIDPETIRRELAPPLSIHITLLIEFNSFQKIFVQFCQAMGEFLSHRSNDRSIILNVQIAYYLLQQKQVAYLLSNTLIGDPKTVTSHIRGMHAAMVKGSNSICNVPYFASLVTLLQKQQRNSNPTSHLSVIFHITSKFPNDSKYNTSQRQVLVRSIHALRFTNTHYKVIKIENKIPKRDVILEQVTASLQSNDEDSFVTVTTLTITERSKHSDLARSIVEYIGSCIGNYSTRLV